MSCFLVCPRSVYCSCVCCDWPAQFAVHFLLFFGSPFLYGLPYLGTGPCLTVGFAFSSAHPFSYYHLLSYHSIIPAAKLFASILLGLFRPTIYSSPNGPIRPLVFITSLAGSCVPFVFPWASRAHLLSLGFFGPFLNFAFPWVFIEFFGLLRPNYIIPYPWDS